MKYIATGFALLLALLFSPLVVNAQWYLGISGGGGLSGAVGLKMEIPVEVEIKNYLSIRSGLSFLQRTNQEVNRKFSEETTYLHALNYLSLPVLGKLKLDLQPISPYALLGLEVGYGLAANARVLEENGEYYFNERYSFAALGIRRIDFGLNLGIGLEAQIRKHRKLFVEMQYFLGLSNIDLDVDSDLYNQGAVISLGVWLPINKVE